jgi:hypothetical protein
MVRIIPDYAPLREENKQHEPKGTPDRNGDGRGDGGQFAKKDGTTTPGAVKYPRTPHLPWSQGATDDDIVAGDMRVLRGSDDVVVTEKMDGENTTLYRDKIHARSIDSGDHPSRSWVKQFHASIKDDIPEGWRVSGENVYATHSVAYDALPSYFLGFSVWDAHNHALPWDETLEWFDLLGITPVATLYRGPFDEKKIKALNTGPGSDKREGYVVRTANGFAYEDFSTHLAKYVRKGHVQPNAQHWAHRTVRPNTLRRTPR